MKNIVRRMENLCERSIPFALATVISRNGSAPRSVGAKMLVQPDGEIIGTVGGGILEAQVRQQAIRMIEERSAVIESFQFSGKDAATMDAICGGQVEVLVEWIDPAIPETAAMVQGLRSAIAGHCKAWLITILEDGSTSTTHAVVQQDQSVLGVLPRGLTIEEIVETRLPQRFQINQQQVIIEPINIAGTVYIFGAGHVSRSLAEFTRAVGFWTIVLDDRAEYVNRDRFPETDELVVLHSFSNALETLSIDQDSYVVIVTRGHLNDQKVLAQVLKTNAAYIGMIGSRRKCALVFEELRKTGTSEEDIQRVHAPIGLPISAETPEEIGISITAEMIAVRAKLQK